MIARGVKADVEGGGSCDDERMRGDYAWPCD